jgi:HEAT repeat protein
MVEKRTALAHLGLGKEAGKAAPYLRALLAGVKEGLSDLIRRVPFFGPLALGTGAALLELANEQDDQALEKKVGELLSGVEHSGETLEVLALFAQAIYVQQALLLERLELGGAGGGRAQLTAVAAATALAAYRGRVAQGFRYADYRGIEGMTREEHAAALPMDEVYVGARLVAEALGADSRERERELLKRLDDQDLSPRERMALEEEFAGLTEERWRGGKQQKGEGQPAAAALAAARHAVVIGGPGVGKSSLVRYLSRATALGEQATLERLGWAETLMPVVLPLAAFADARSREAGLSLRRFLDCRLGTQGGQALREAVTAEIDGGRAYFLLDGIDEIPDSRDRMTIVQAVDRFVAEHAANRFLITSRPAGYVRLAGDVPHFRLPNFSPEQVAEFLGRWHRAFERWRHPAAPDLAAAERAAAAAVAEIRRNPKVEELARNPLMLVILALIRHEQGRFPEERVQLYNRATNTLMDSWNRWRSLAEFDVGGIRLKLDQMVSVWAAVAEWTRRERPTGVVHRVELEGKLVAVLTERELDEEDPAATARSYLNVAADRAGLLEERSKDIFAFWHPTFEEFLAAVELATPSGRASERLLPLREDPRWREVILLAVGYLGIVQRDRETATALVEALWLREPGPLEGLWHPNLLLAAACVADDVGVKRGLAERLIVALGEVVRGLPQEPYVATFLRTVRAVGRLRPSPETVRALVPLLGHAGWEVRMEAARLFANVAAENPEARDLCQRLLADPNPDVRCHAALGLARSGDYSARVWAALAWLSVTLAGIRDTGAQYLRTMPPEAFTRLLEALTLPTCQGLEVDLVLAANREPGRVREALLRVQGGKIRVRAAEALGRLGEAPARIRGLLEPVLVERDSRVRIEAVRWLQLLDGDPARLREALTPILEHEELGARLQALRVLRDLGEEPGRLLQAAEGMLREIKALDLVEGEIVDFACNLAIDRVQVREVVKSLLASFPHTKVSWDDPYGAAEWRIRELSVRKLTERAAFMESLVGFLDGGDVETRLGAVEALVLLKFDPVRLHRALVRVIEEGDAEEKIRAAELALLLGAVPDART